MNMMLFFFFKVDILKNGELIELLLKQKSFSIVKYSDI